MTEPNPYSDIHHRAHTLTVDQVEEELKTDIEKGLTLQDHETRFALHGPNKIPEQKKVSYAEMLWAQINSMIIYILIIGAAISFAFDHLVDGVVIIGVVVINIGLGFYMEARAVSATDSLKNMMSPVAVVIRNGEKITVETVTLVPGDIVVVQPGDIAPADARIIKQTNLQMMEAALTGESHATMKDVLQSTDGNVSLADRKCMIFSGTQVIKGTATCIVTATAANCEIGKISGLLADIAPAKTPLLLQLERFGLILSLIIIGFSFGTFGIAMARGYSVGDSLSIAIGVAVAAIPEGLPSCITVTFAIGVHFMAKQNAIVKSLPAVETLGSVSVICSDKTGTLTMNKMSVQRVVRLCDSDAEIDTAAQLSPDQQSQTLSTIIPGVLCNDSTLLIAADLPPSPADGANAGDIELAGVGTSAPPSPSKAIAAQGWEVEGDPTERCILELGVTLSKVPQALKKLMNRHPREGEIPFDSATKYMATMHTLSDELAAHLSAAGGQAAIAAVPGGKQKVVYVKGAPEKVLSFCFCAEDTRPETVTARAYWLKQAEGLAQQGMRVLGLAYRVFPSSYALPESLSALTVEHPETAFHMSALVGIIDPPRPEAIEAVKVAQSAGVIVKMITGDHPVTAHAIGRTLGLQVEKGHAITGTELDEITIRSMAELDDCVVQNDVFARTTPEHKLRIVESLRRQGYVCSMTGDGVNDAPALKAANIGVAMGITGTEVAKDAANMIITDDNFATIVDAVRIGRCTYANLIKIIAFVLPTNGGQAFSIIAALIIGVNVPITALQILWVNMITSVTLGIVLAFDQPDRSVLEERPRASHKPIFGKLLSWRVFSVTIYLILLVLGMFQWEKHRHDSVNYLRTCSVNALVTAQIGYIFNCRTLRRNTDCQGLFLGNPYLYVGIIAIVSCQVVFTYAPPFQYIFHTEPIDGESWGKIIMFAVVIFLVVELDKYLNTLRLQAGTWWNSSSRGRYDSIGSGKGAGGQASAHGAGGAHGGHAHSVVGGVDAEGRPIFVRRNSLRRTNSSSMHNTSIYDINN